MIRDAFHWITLEPFFDVFLCIFWLFCYRNQLFLQENAPTITFLYENNCAHTGTHSGTKPFFPVYDIVVFFLCVYPG